MGSLADGLEYRWIDAIEIDSRRIEACRRDAEVDALMLNQSTHFFDASTSRAFVDPQAREHREFGQYLGQHFVPVYDRFRDSGRRRRPNDDTRRLGLRAPPMSII